MKSSETFRLLNKSVHRVSFGFSVNVKKSRVSGSFVFQIKFIRCQSLKLWLNVGLAIVWSTKWNVCLLHVFMSDCFVCLILRVLGFRVKRGYSELMKFPTHKYIYFDKFPDFCKAATSSTRSWRGFSSTAPWSSLTFWCHSFIRNELKFWLSPIFDFK